MLTDEDIDIAMTGKSLPMDFDELKQFARDIESAVLAKAGEQEPVAYCYPWDAKKLQTTECSAEVYSIPVVCPDGESSFALYAAPLPAQAIPEGWQLVPIEPTYNMLIEKGCKSHLEGEQCHHHDRRKRIWESMLSASPKP